MRAPIFLRLREDKSPNECRIETEEHPSEVIRHVVDDATTYHTPSFYLSLELDLTWYSLDHSE
jgi:hypothetical protein